MVLMPGMTFYSSSRHHCRKRSIPNRQYTDAEWFALGENIKRVWNHAQRPDGGLKMKRQRGTSRIYWREGGGKSRRYSELREYADGGGVGESPAPTAGMPPPPAGT